MKKILIIIFLLLIITSAAAADRIAPTKDIGLFIDMDVFWNGLKKTPLFDQIVNTDFQEYPFYSSLIKYVAHYYLDDDTYILLWINKYDRIHAIKIVIEPLYLIRDDCFEDYQLTGYVLLAAGLLTHDDDLAAIDAVKNNNDFHLGRNFLLTRYVDDINLNIEINNIYKAADDLDPYSLMEVFSEHPCDPNYVGACIPIVSYDLDCTDIPVKNFFVTGTDKHRFDGDGNGVCCEPYPIQ